MSKRNRDITIPYPVTQELKALGQRIRSNRKALRWTLESLAQRCFCSVPTLRALEQGKATVSLSVLMNVLWCLNEYRGIAKLCPVKHVTTQPKVDDSWKDI